jgi:hypothetical protein
MRFEVLKREAEIACWQAIADGADRRPGWRRWPRMGSARR